MKSNQPIWQFIANLGDNSPLDFGGLFVYSDTTGRYAPECVRLERITSDEVTGKAERWEVRRFVCEPCTFIDGVLSDNRFHPSSPAWFADSLPDMAESMGMDKDALIALFTSNDACERAHAWRIVGDFHGFANLDDYPETYTRKDLYRLYRVECFPRSIRRNVGARKARRAVPSGEVGPFSIAAL